MHSGLKHKQRGATFIGMVIIFSIVGVAVYTGIRLVPVYLEYMAVARAMNQTADSLKGGEVSPGTIRRSLERRWEIEDIKQLDYKDVEMNKVDTGIEMHAQYRAVAPLIANISIVVDFDKKVIVSTESGGT